MLERFNFYVNFLEEAAVKLGQHREFVTRLVEWSACEEHPGVKGTIFLFLFSFLNVITMLCSCL